MCRHVVCDGKKCLYCPHGTIWEEADELDLGKAIRYRFKVNPVVLRGQLLTSCSEKQLWELCYPLASLPATLDAINKRGLDRYRTTWQKVNTERLYHFLGVVLAMVCWGPVKPKRKYWGKGDTKTEIRPAPNFGARYGMSLKAWERIWVNFALSLPDTHAIREDNYAEFRQFLNAFNEQRQTNFAASTVLTVDESSSQWTGELERKGRLDGVPNITFNPTKPHPVAIEAKTMVDGETGIVLQAEIMEGKVSMPKKEFWEQYGPTTALLLRLTKPYWGTQRHVLGDAWFSSVRSALALAERGLKYTGSIKHAHSQFPKDYFIKTMEGEERGTTKVLAWNAFVQTSHGLSCTKVAAVGWRDQNTKTFVTTTGSTSRGRNQQRKWKKIEGTGPTRKSVPYSREIPQTKFIEAYWDHFGLVDRHNHFRHSGLDLETILGTKHWVRRLWSSFFAMSVVDAHLLHQWVHGGKRRTLRSFVSRLARQLIDTENIEMDTDDSELESDDTDDEDLTTSHGLRKMVNRRLIVIDSLFVLSYF
jgi:hypothetical protein